MVSTVEVRRAESVPSDARVGHYDELDEAAKHRLPEVAESEGAASVDGEAGTALATYDLVKFTDYYRVERVA